MEINVLFDKIMKTLKCSKPSKTKESPDSVYCEWTPKREDAANVYLEVFRDNKINYGAELEDGSRKFYSFHSDGRLPNMFVNRMQEWIGK